MGHVMRREKLKSIKTVSKTEGRRGRGRQRGRDVKRPDTVAWKDISKHS